MAVETVNSTPEPLVRVRDLSIQFAESAPVLQNIDLTIGNSDTIALVGPSGCGKSTLLKALAGLLKPATGVIEIDGHAPESARRSGFRTAFVFQEANLLPWRTALGNARLPLELDGTWHKSRLPEVQAALELVGLSPTDWNKRPGMLSGGMKMRVSLARSLVKQPQLLLLDEPFAALDDLLRQQLNEDLLRIWGQQQWASVFVTHNVAEAVFLSQRIFVLGKRPARLLDEIAIPFAYPRHPELRSAPEFAALTGSISHLLREAAT